MENGADISKMIGALMQNPELMSQIKSLMTGAQSTDDDANSRTAEKSEPAEQASIQIREPSASDENDDGAFHKNRRNELMRALKPYVSHKRAEAIDSMLSIVEVFSIMKEK